MFEEALENQITFQMTELNDGVQVHGTEIECLTAIGDFKNIIGNYVLRPHRSYTFTFRIINSLNCKIGVVDREFVDKARSENKPIVGAFSDFVQGFSLFSNGHKRNGSSALKGTKVVSGFQPGDYVTICFDSVNGSMSVFINKVFSGVLFLDRSFTNREFYPALAMIGEKEKIRHIFF